MQTQRVDITSDAWVEINQGSTVILAEGGASGSFLIHFSNTATAPELTAPAHEIQTFQAALDFTQYNLTPGQRVWVKSKSGDGYIIATREVDVFVRFIPSGSDFLITADGNTFNSKEAA